MNIFEEAKRQLKTHYDIICPIGQWCAPAIYLSKLNLRTMALPFDWVGGLEVSLTENVDIICNHFEHFIDKELLVKIGLDGEDRYVYRNTRLRCLFMHDFLTAYPFEETWPLVKAKYDRRIRRFYQEVTKSSNVLFVHFARTIILTEEEIRQAWKRLQKEFPSTKVHLLVINHIPSIREASVRRLDEGLFSAEGPFYKAEVDLVRGDVELCTQLFKAIRLKGYWRNVLRKRYRRCKMHFMTIFHFSSEKRRATRDNFWKRDPREGE